MPISSAQFERNAKRAAQLDILDDGKGEPDSAKVPALLDDAGVPERLCQAKISEIKPDSTREALIEAQGELRAGAMVGVLLVGLSRTGKSTALAALLRYYGFRGKTIAWRTMDEMTSSNYEQVRGGDHEKDKAEQERWRLQEVFEVLAIDNVDLLCLTDYSARHVLSIVRARSDNGLITCISQPSMPKASSVGFAKSAVLSAQSLAAYMQGAMVAVECLCVP